MSIRGQSVIVAMRAMTGLFSLSTTGRTLMLLKVSVADQLSQAKDFQDVLRIQTEFMRTQMQAFAEQATSLAESFTKTAASEIKMPFKTSLE